jgi:hypothetical protein
MYFEYVYIDSSDILYYDLISSTSLFHLSLDI